MHPIRSSNKKPTKNITKLKKYQKEFILQKENAERYLCIAGGIAHDFNIILYSNIGMSELIMEDLTPESYEYDNAIAVLKITFRFNFAILWFASK